jgi:hypothetical protein
MPVIADQFYTLLAISKRRESRFIGNRVATNIAI